MNSGVLTSLLLPHLSSSLTDSMPSLNLLCHSKTDVRFMQDAPKAVWTIPYVSVAFFPSLKQNFIAYCSSKVSSRPDCIFEIHQLGQPGFSRVYSNCCCSCSFEPEIIKTGQSSYKMYINNILNFQESTAILNACTKRSGNLLNAPCIWNILTKDGIYWSNSKWICSSTDKYYKSLDKYLWNYRLKKYRPRKFVFVFYCECKWVS